MSRLSLSVTIACFFLATLTLAQLCSAAVPVPTCSTNLTAATIKSGAPVQLPNVSCSSPTDLTSYVEWTVVALAGTGNLSFDAVPSPFGTTYGVTFDFPVQQGNETDCGNGDESGFPFPQTFTPTAACATNATGLPALCNFLYDVKVVCVPAAPEQPAGMLRLRRAQRAS